jgi:hypothetical protein
LGIHVESSVPCLSPLPIHSYLQQENLGSSRKFVKHCFLFLCIANQIHAQHRWSMGWRNLSKIAEKQFLQPTCSECPISLKIDTNILLVLIPTNVFFKNPVDKFRFRWCKANIFSHRYMLCTIQSCHRLLRTVPQHKYIPFVLFISICHLH